MAGGIISRPVRTLTGGRLSALKAIRCSDVACIRGGRLLFKNLNFEVASGALLSIEGRNGAGKSSLLRMIAGFLPPASGALRIVAEDGETEDAELRGAYIGFLGHQDAVKPQLTVSEQLAFFAGLYDKSAPAEVLARVGLGGVATAPCQYLSAGQKKRLGLARLLVTGRPLWLLDEPYSALDTEGRAVAADLIRAHLSGGGIAIAATHEPLGLGGTRLMLGN